MVAAGPEPSGTLKLQIGIVKPDGWRRSATILKHVLTAHASFDFLNSHHRLKTLDGSHDC